MRAEEIYAKAVEAKDPKLKAALFRLWKKAKSAEAGGEGASARAVGRDTRPHGMHMTHDAAMVWQEIRQRVQACKACRLHEGRRHAVMGEGQVPAYVMLIGEAPGAVEDQQGRPFVGPSGKLLEQMLGDVGWDRTDVYIANVVACRPPNNATPDKADVDACRGFLEEQIDLVQPTVIVTLGGTALGWFDGTKRVTRDHGVPFKVGMHWVFPTFHPAAALRNRAWVQTMKEDFKKLAEFVPTTVPYHDALQGLCRDLMRGKVRVKIRSRKLGGDVWITPRLMHKAELSKGEAQVEVSRLVEAMQQGTMDALLRELRGEIAADTLFWWELDGQGSLALAEGSTA